MLSERAVHVSRRRWSYLGLGVWLYSLIPIGVYLIVTTSSLGSMDPTLDNIAFYGTWFSILLGLGTYPIMMFIKSKRIEFFEDHIIVHAGGKYGVMDVPYDKIRLGVPKLRFIKGGISMHFKLILKESNVSYDVGESRLRKLNTGLYSWLRTKVS